MPTMRIPYGVLDGRYVNAEGDDMSGQLDIIDASGAQLRLEHTEDSKFADFTVDTNHDLTIKPSSTGQIILQPTTDSIDFFQVLDADGGTPILNVDSVNEIVGIGTATPSQHSGYGNAIDIVGGIALNQSTPGQTGTYLFATFNSVGAVLNYVAYSYGDFVFANTAASQEIRFYQQYDGSPVEVLRMYGYKSYFTQPLGINTTGPDRKLDVLDASAPQLRLTHTDGSVYTDFQTDGSGYLTITPSGLIVKTAASIYPATDDTYYLGKNDDDTPFAWKGLILKDTTNGKYYRIEVINGTITATDLTD